MRIPPIVGTLGACEPLWLMKEDQNPNHENHLVRKDFYSGGKFVVSLSKNER